MLPSLLTEAESRSSIETSPAETHVQTLQGEDWPKTDANIWYEGREAGRDQSSNQLCKAGHRNGRECWWIRIKALLHKFETEKNCGLGGGCSWQKGIPRLVGSSNGGPAQHHRPKGAPYQEPVEASWSPTLTVTNTSETRVLWFVLGYPSQHNGRGGRPSHYPSKPHANGLSRYSRTPFRTSLHSIRPLLSWIANYHRWALYERIQEKQVRRYSHEVRSSRASAPPIRGGIVSQKTTVPCETLFGLYLPNFRCHLTGSTHRDVFKRISQQQPSFPPPRAGIFKFQQPAPPLAHSTDFHK